jgi:hypothetical protein
VGNSANTKSKAVQNEKKVVTVHRFVLHKTGHFAYVLLCVGNCANTKSKAVQQMRKSLPNNLVGSVGRKDRQRIIKF